MIIRYAALAMMIGENRTSHSRLSPVRHYATNLVEVFSPVSAENLTKRLFHHCLCLGYLPPHRTTVARRLKRLSDVHHYNLKQQLLAVKSIAISCDFWTDKSMKSYICLTGHHGTHEFDTKSTILSFDAFFDRHFGVRIAKVVQEKLSKLGILHKLQSITSDGAGNMVTMHQALIDNTSNRLDWVWCVAHRLHLVIANGFQLWTKRKPAKKSSDDRASVVDVNTTAENNIGTVNESVMTTSLVTSDAYEDTQAVWDDATQGKCRLSLWENFGGFIERHVMC